MQDDHANENSESGNNIVLHDYLNGTGKPCGSAIGDAVRPQSYAFVFDVVYVGIDLHDEAILWKIEPFGEMNEAELWEGDN